jgi:phage FluMu protein Com
MNSNLVTKDFSSTVKDVSDEGIVSIYVNKFNNVDSSGEISDPKSFNKTIADGISRIKHLKDHDQHKLLGLPIEIIPDSFGLLVKSAMNLKKDMVRDVFEDYKFFANYNRTLEHSIGTVIVKQVPDGQYKRNMEYALFEYSTLSFLGANPETPLVSLKNDNNFQQLQFLNEMLKGNYTDERFKILENNINLIRKSMEGQIIVKCPCCGLVFDYNSCEERTVESIVRDAVVNYTRWTIEDTVSQEMQRIKPEMQSQVLEMVHSTKGIDLNGMFNHVRCPKCYSIVTSKSLANSEPTQITQKDKPIKIDYKSLSEKLKIN